MGTVRTSSARGSVEVNTHGPRTHPPLLSTTSAVERAGPAPTAAAAAAPRRLAPTGTHGPLGDSAILGIDDEAAAVSDQSPAPKPEPPGRSSSSSTRTPERESRSQRISYGGGAGDVRRVARRHRHPTRARAHPGPVNREGHASELSLGARRGPQRRRGWRGRAREIGRTHAISVGFGGW